MNKELIKTLSDYSNDDILKSFFVIDLCINNIASQLKIQYLYSSYEIVSQNILENKNRISTYADFRELCLNLYKNVPDFVHLEDYTPVMDWGEVKYSFEGVNYKIFYGNELEHVVDFYKAMELIHIGNENIYLKELGRSFKKEFKQALIFQDHILNVLVSDKKKSIDPGTFLVPTQKFWTNAIDFLEKNNFEELLGKGFLDLYLQRNGGPEKKESTFNENAFHGKNCRYNFFKAHESYYPALPRKQITNLYDEWGDCLEKLIDSGRITADKAGSNLTASIGLFLKKRLPESKLQILLSPLVQNNIVKNITFAGALVGEKKLYLFLHTGIFESNNGSLEKVMEGLNSLALDLMKYGLKFITHLERGKAIEFKGKRETTIEYILVLPNIHTYSERGSIVIPNNYKGKVWLFDTFLGIMDEIDSVEEFEKFINYLNTNSGRVGMFNDTLDIFGSFILSKGVLTPGATDFTSIFLAGGYGTGFRYDSLKKFWDIYPKYSITPDPREWIVKSGGKQVTLYSKSNSIVIYSKDIGDHSFYITGLHKDVEDIDLKITDQLMGIIVDGLNELFVEIVRHLYNIHGGKFQIIIAPSDYIYKNRDTLRYWEHLIIKDGRGLLIDEIYEVSDRYFGTRVTFNTQVLADALLTSNTRDFEIQVITLILTKIFNYFGIDPDSEMKEKLENLKTKKKRYGIFTITKEAGFPEREATIIPDDTDFKIANKRIAGVLKKKKILPNIIIKTTDESIKIITEIRSAIISEIETSIKVFGFSSSIGYIISKHDALQNDFFMKISQVRNALDQDKDYQSEELSHKYNVELRNNSSNYRFLIEKFNQLRPTGKKVISGNSLKDLLALVGMLIDVQFTSDVINNRVHNATIEVSADYVISISYHDGYDVKNKQYGEYLQKVSLGLIGSNGDSDLIEGELEKYLDEFDEKFELDLGFSFKLFLSFLNILRFWGSGDKEKAFYEAPKIKLIDRALNELKDIDEAMVNKMLGFITIDKDSLLLTTEDGITFTKNSELPIWEHYKRPFRYSLNPLVQKKDLIFIWGAYSIFQTQKIWLNVRHHQKLPANFNMPETRSFLELKHKEIENYLEVKTKGIAEKYSKYVQNSVFLHKIDKSIQDIGDVDVLVFLPEKSIILSIETKIIDGSFSIKDAGREKEKMFGRINSKGEFDIGYVQKHDRRHEYLVENYKKIFAHFNWTPPKKAPEIRSLFLVKGASWWIKDIQIKTKIEFIELKLLEEYLSNLT